MKSVARTGFESSAVVNIGKLELGLLACPASKLSFAEGWIVREDLLACKLLNK